MQKKLYLSTEDKKIWGVCGGFGEYFGIDSNIVRVIWSVLSLLYGVGVAVYIICAFVIPEKPKEIK